MNTPRLSIITVCFNSERFIASAIHSVFSQTYKDIEYIIVDGASKDKTIEIIEEFKAKDPDRLRFISEADKGIYDAMNKGIKMAKGEIVGILNSDDFYKNERVFENLIALFDQKSCDAIYGDLVYVDQENTNRVIRNWKSSLYEKGLFRKGWHPAHPTFFVKRHLYEKFGIFKTELKLGADFELMLRFIEKHEISLAYLEEVMVVMRMGGASNKSIKNVIQCNKECYSAWALNDLDLSLFQYLKLDAYVKFQLR